MKDISLFKRIQAQARRNGIGKREIKGGGNLIAPLESFLDASLGG